MSLVPMGVPWLDGGVGNARLDMRAEAFLPQEILLVSALGSMPS